MPQFGKVLCEQVCKVIRRGYVENAEVAIFELLPYVMLVHVDVLRATIDAGILC